MQKVVDVHDTPRSDPPPGTPPGGFGLGTSFQVEPFQSSVRVPESRPSVPTAMQNVVVTHDMPFSASYVLSGLGVGSIFQEGDPDTTDDLIGTKRPDEYVARESGCISGRKALMATSATARRTTILAVILWIAFKPILDILSILCNCHHINTSLASMGVSTEPPCHSYSISDCTWGGIAVFPPCLFVRTHNVVENTLWRDTTTLSIKLNQVNVNYLKIKSVTLFGSLQLLSVILGYYHAN